MKKEINIKPNTILDTPAVKCLTVSLDNSLTGTLSGEDAQETYMPHVIDLIRDLKDTAESLKDNCLGLAANQIWDNPEIGCPSVFIMRWPNSKDPQGWEWKVVINPRINTTGKTLKFEESCLSMPGRIKRLSRGQNVEMSYQEEDSHAVKYIKFFRRHGIYPSIVQHEYNHLMGKTII
jgi:peptide deformylase